MVDNIFSILYIIFMDKNRLEERRRKKREEILLMFGTYKSMEEIALAKGITKQAVNHLFKKYNVIKEWKEHTYQIRGFEGSCVYAIYFLKEPWKKYYGSTTHFRRRMSEHLNHLIKMEHENTFLQMDFNKHGIENLKFEIIKKIPSEQFLEEEKKLIDSDPFFCYNKKSVITDLMAYEDERSRKRRLLPGRKSKYKYITWHKPSQMWRPQIYINGKQIFIGYFKKEEDAKKAVDKFLKEPQREHPLCPRIPRTLRPPKDPPRKIAGKILST